MGPLLIASLFFLLPAAAENTPAPLPDSILQSLRVSFALGDRLPAAAPDAIAQDYAQTKQYLALLAQLKAVQERQAPAQAAAFEAFLPGYVDEIEQACEALRCLPGDRTIALRTYLSRLSRPDSPPETRRLVGAFMNPQTADAATRERVQALLARRAVGTGPSLQGVDGAFGPGAPGPGGTPSRGGTALPEAAGVRRDQRGAAAGMRASEFQPQQRIGLPANVPLAVAQPSPGLLLSAQALWGSALASVKESMPDRHAMRVMDEASGAFPTTSPSNTEHDAWRHARWHQRMVTDVCGDRGAWCKGPMSVAAVGTGAFHELSGAVRGQPWAEFKMDMRNNWNGMLAAWRGGDRAHIDRLLEEGKLTVITPTGKKPK